jgi:hypothetical protein
MKEVKYQVKPSKIKVRKLHSTDACIYNESWRGLGYSGSKNCPAALRTFLTVCEETGVVMVELI